MATSIDSRLLQQAGPSPKGMPPTLERARTLLDYLGNPERRLQAIHVGGSAGKGSTAAYIAAMLDAAGYSTGLHMKPHLESVTERFVYRQQCITPAELNLLLDAALPAVERMRTAGKPPTWFELCVALCFQWLASKRAFPAVIEVGLGGTWDATNVLQPLLSVITEIGQDHTEILGSDVTSIAREKAGIIKAGRPLVTSATDPLALDILLTTAASKGSSTWVIGRDIAVSGVRTGSDGGLFDLQLPDHRYEQLQIAMLGEHQVRNAALAVAAIHSLSRLGLHVDELAIRAGLGSCRVAGRLSRMLSNPDVYLDGAHSPMKMQAGVQAVRVLAGGKRVVAVVAMRPGHDPLETLAPLAHLASAVIVTSLRTPGVSSGGEQSPAHLAHVLRVANPNLQVLVEPSSSLALDHAIELAGANGVVYITGSLYLAGDLKSQVEAMGDTAARATP